MLIEELLTEKITARITRGKAYDSEFAPIVYRFTRVPYDYRDVFNRITQRYKSARDAKKRFYWNSDFSFWYTQNATSMEEARKELEQYGIGFE